MSTGIAKYSVTLKYVEARKPRPYTESDFGMFSKPS